MTAPKTMWKKIDLAQTTDHFWLEDGDDCYCAREYISHGGWQASEANQLISNFKKEPSKKAANPYEWKHKLKAIKQFANELALVFDEKSKYFVCAIPPSKCHDDPDYDSRLDDTLTELCKIRPKIKICNAIKRIYSVKAAHSHNDDRPKPDDVYESIEWDDAFEYLPHLVLIDDVLTTGSHFKACQRLARENMPGIDVFGVFWARRIWQNGEAVD